VEDFIDEEEEDEVDTVDRMEVQEGHDEMVHVAKERKVRVNWKKRKKIRNNKHPSVEKEDEVAEDSVEGGAIVTIVPEVEGGDRALTPKDKTLGREEKVSKKTNVKAVTTSAVADPEVVVGGVADEAGGDSLVVSIAEELQEDVLKTAKMRGEKDVRKARRSQMKVLRKSTISGNIPLQVN